MASYIAVFLGGFTVGAIGTMLFARDLVQKTLEAIRPTKTDADFWKPEGWKPDDDEPRQGWSYPYD